MIKPRVTGGVPKQLRTQRLPSEGLPQRFVRSGKRQRARVKDAARSGGPAEKLKSMLAEPYAFCLKAKDLGLPQVHELPGALYSDTSVKAWRQSIGEVFQGCLFYALELGSGDYKNPKRGKVHAHVIAAKHDGPKHLQRNSERCKAVYDFEGLVAYMYKLPEVYSLEAHLDYQVARIRSGKAPRLKGWLLGKKRCSWNTVTLNAVTLNAAPLP